MSNLVDLLFHQDNPYQDWHDSSGGVITAWIALEEVTKEMGGLEFAVGSHRVSQGEILTSHLLIQTITELNLKILNKLQTLVIK